MSRRHLAGLVGAVALVGLVPAVASGATFTVSSTGDQIDSAAGNGVCLTAVGTCTLRAAIQETNALVAGGPHTIAFAIPTSDGGYDPGTGVFTIVPGAVLPTITGVGTVVDGTTQATSAAGNTNPGVLGTGGTVGVDGVVLPQVQRPEILVRDGAALNTGLAASVSNVQILGLGIHGFGTLTTNGDIVLTGATNGVRIVGNVIGSVPTAVALPAVAAQQSAGNGVTINAPDNGFVQNNLVAFQGFHGIVARGAAAGWTISGNETRSNGRTNNAAGGIATEAAGTINNAISGNLVVASGGAGIDTAASVGPNRTTNNSVTNNGVFNNATAETSGVRVQGSNNTIDRNVVNANYGAGVMVVNASQTNRITRNSIFANGTILNLGGTAATTQIGIDLLVAANSQTRGTLPFVSINDAGDADAGGNAITNFPVLATAQRTGGNLIVSGLARPGAIVELFLAAADGSGFGEGRTYLTSLVEGSGADTDATTGTYGPGAINGLLQGTDTTERFTFTIPLTSLPAAVPAGSTLTATATLLNATSEFSGNVTVAELAADVQVALADSPDPVAIGQPITYVATVTNNGPGFASAITTSQILPLGATFTGVTPGQGSCSQLLGTVTCALGLLAPGASTTITVTAVPGNLGIATSNITVAAAETDLVQGNNTAATTTSVVATADVSVTMSDAPDPASLSQNVTFTAVVANAGPDPAFSVTLSDLPTAGLTVVSATPSQGTCSLAVTCSIGSIAAGGSATVSIVATATALGSIGNSVTVTTTSTDPAGANNSASTTTTVTALSVPAQTVDLGLDVHTSRTGVSPAGELTAITAILTNRGTAAATGTVVTLLLANARVVTTAESAGDCTVGGTSAGRTLTCTTGRIEPGERATIAVVVQASKRGRVSAVASAAGDQTDATPGDTTSIPASAAPPLGRLTVRIDAPTRVRAGTVVPYTVTVRNATSSPARDVVLALAPPFGGVAAPIAIRSLSARTNGLVAGRAVALALGDLAPGETRIVSLTTVARRPLGARRIAAAAIAVDGVAGGHALDRIRVVAGLRGPPVTG